MSQDSPRRKAVEFAALVEQMEKADRKRPALRFDMSDEAENEPSKVNGEASEVDSSNTLSAESEELPARFDLQIENDPFFDVLDDNQEDFSNDLMDEIGENQPVAEAMITSAPAYSFATESQEEVAEFQIDLESKDKIENYRPEKKGLMKIETPEDLITELEGVGYYCAPFLAAQLSLCLNTKTEKVRSIMLEGPPGCGKSFMAKSLSQILDAEFMCLSCYSGMNYQHLIESPSTIAMVNAMAGSADSDPEKLMNLGILSRAFITSQEKPVVLLIDEIDKVEDAIDTFFLGPLQDAEIWPESRGPIKADINNLLIVMTKNFERDLNDALMRRVHPITLNYLDAAVERKVLAPHCLPQLIDNLSVIADIMRDSNGSYKFDRPPAPEELLSAGRFMMQLLEWNVVDYKFIGRNVWNTLAKSDNDRYVLELMLRYHPDFYDSLNPNGRQISINEVYAKLGRVLLKEVVQDPEDEKRKAAYKAESEGFGDLGTPDQLVGKLAEVGYECLPYLAKQMSLLINTPLDRVKAFLLEGPPGCGKSYMAKSLAKITGAEFMCLSCYSGMDIQHLIEQPSTLGLANAMSSGKGAKKTDLVNLGILSRAYLKSQNQPVILLIDEIDKVEVAIDTFFLGPLQDGTIYLESRPPIDAKLENILIIFTKNYERVLNDALLRRLHPIHMTYLNADLERKILSKHCDERLISNMISVVNRMRDSGGSYGFDRPPAPEEMLILGHYVNNLLGWGITDFAEVGGSIWSSICKSEHDRSVLEHMMRFHPDFLDPLMPDGKSMTKNDVHAKLGRAILDGIIEDPDKKTRERAWKTMDYNY